MYYLNCTFNIFIDTFFLVAIRSQLKSCSSLVVNNSLANRLRLLPMEGPLKVEYIFITCVLAMHLFFNQTNCPFFEYHHFEGLKIVLRGAASQKHIMRE